MSRVLKADFYRIKKSPLFLFMIVYYIALISILGIHDGLQTRICDVAGMVMPFVLFLVTGFAATEYKNNTMKNYIASGNSRKEVYFGKLISLLVTCAVLYAIGLVINSIGVVVLSEVGSVNIVKIIAVILLSLLGMTISIAIYFGISTVIKNQSISLTICVAIDYGTSFAAFFIDEKFHTKIFSKLTLSQFMLDIPKLKFSVFTICQIAIGIIIAVVINVIAYKIFKKKTI